jgi:hypothetical protein
MGFGVSLPPAYLPRIHSREPKPPSGQRCQTPAHVPPSWFRTTTTVFSTRESRVCCTPQPAKGSPRFLLAATAPPGGGRATGQSPRRGSHPSKTSPRQQPYCITAAVAFLSLPSCPTWPPADADHPADRSATEVACVHRAIPCPQALTAATPRGTVSWYPARGVRSSIGRSPEGYRGHPEG